MLFEVQPGDGGVHGQLIEAGWVRTDRCAEDIDDDGSDRARARGEVVAGDRCPSPSLVTSQARLGH